jgi:hypothetical protein
MGVDNRQIEQNILHAPKTSTPGHRRRRRAFHLAGRDNLARLGEHRRRPADDLPCRPAVIIAADAGE